MLLMVIFEINDEAYHMNYRGLNIGGIKAEVQDEKNLKMIVRSFELDDLWFGNVHGMLRRFAPEDMRCTISYSSGNPRREACRDVTVFDIVFD